MFRIADARRWETRPLRGWRSHDREEEIARACHELRGSLTAVRMGLGGGGAELTPARRRALDLELEKAALALDDLAGRARGGSGLLVSMRPRRVDLDELLVDAVEAWRGMAEQRDVRLQLRRAGDASGVAQVIVGGHRLRLAQAVGNLIANAIEHGAGPVEVRLRRDDPLSVRIEVADGGGGLPAPVDELVRQVAGGRGRRGRGLAIAASIAEAHGGRLAAAPSDRGARLVLELPR
jgi:signal transduction histidine kinase